MHGCSNSCKEGCFPIHVPPWFWEQALPSKLPAACPYLRYLILCFNITPFAATAWRPHPASLACSKCLRFSDRPPRYTFAHLSVFVLFGAYLYSHLCIEQHPAAANPPRAAAPRHDPASHTERTPPSAPVQVFTSGSCVLLYSILSKNGLHLPPLQTPPRSTRAGLAAEFSPC